MGRLVQLNPEPSREIEKGKSYREFKLLMVKLVKNDLEGNRKGSS